MLRMCKAFLAVKRLNDDTHINELYLHMPNSAFPDQRTHSSTHELGIHCLPTLSLRFNLFLIYKLCWSWLFADDRYTHFLQYTCKKDLFTTQLNPCENFMNFLWIVHELFINYSWKIHKILTGEHLLVPQRHFKLNYKFTCFTY